MVPVRSGTCRGRDRIRSDRALSPSRRPDEGHGGGRGHRRRLRHFPPARRLRRSALHHRPAARRRPLPARHAHRADVGLEGAGARPQRYRGHGWRAAFCLLSLALAPWTSTRWFAPFPPVRRLARRERVPLIGGDLGHAAKVACDIVVCGAIRGGGPSPQRRPRGARHLRFRQPGRLRAGPGRRNAARAPAHLRPEPRTRARPFSARARPRHRRHGSERRALARPPPSRAGLRLERRNSGAAGFSAPPSSRRSTAARITSCSSPPRRAPAYRASSRACRSPELVACGQGRAGVVLLDGAPLPPRGYDHFGNPMAFPIPRRSSI